MGGSRKTFQDPETGRWTRICGRCKQVKDLHNDYYVGKRDTNGEPIEWTWQCKACQTERQGERSRRLRRDPKTAESYRAERQALTQSWRKRNRARYLRTQRRFKAKLMRDPVRHKRYLENGRIAYRLRKERKGLAVTRHFNNVATLSDDLPKLPAKPLGELLVEMASQHETIEELCHELEISSRSYRAWTKGEHQTVQFDVVDRVLTAAGLLWWEVWDAETYPEVQKRMES